VTQRYRAVKNAGSNLDEGSPAADFHRLRIRCKRLRYAAEFLSDVYPESAPDFVKRLVAVQDVLGRHQDAVVAVERLRGMVSEQGPSLSPATLFGMGMVARRYGEEQAQLRARFSKVFRPLSGPAWKRLRREMERNRPQESRPARPVLRSIQREQPPDSSTPKDEPVSPRGAG
jgi:CHAD domain-containing protein